MSYNYYIKPKITPAIRRIAACKPNKNKDNTYNKAYKPPTNIEEEGSNKDNSKEKKEDNSDNNSTSNSTSNSKDKARYKPGNSSLYYKANKDKDNAYNRVYKPPTNIEEEGSSKDNSKEEEEEDNSNNDSTSDSTGNSKDKAGYRPMNSSLRYKDTPLYKQ
ncbi:hypothetical protein P8C59_006411 [Phyllachora maydis]|uniref:Uncharacterized protein n=1 Tax=Phyllachora maydis TaxID=1825666 RepID=A0AAD9I695_9PEZI|nr:hypothetical protein P8C59_006411 [Phyllachora maydis]